MQTLKSAKWNKRVGCKKRNSTLAHCTKTLQSKSTRTTGSPDSDVVVGYISKFNYRPERSHEVLKKYEKLIGATR